MAHSQSEATALGTGKQMTFLNSQLRMESCELEHEYTEFVMVGKNRHDWHHDKDSLSIQVCEAQ